jgi:hypothetical protein
MGLASEPYGPDSIDRASDELTDFSPSRLTTAGKCGLAFEYQYVRKIPAPYEGAKALFGNAVHDGLQEWYALDPVDGAYGYQITDLAPIVLKQWERLLPPVIWRDVLALRDLDEECAAVAAAIVFKRPHLKAPRQTQEYMQAEAVREFNEARVRMIDLCDRLEQIKWSKDEDPYKAYQKSAELAANMQRRWQRLPPPLAVEHPFRIEVEGFVVRGRIDQLRADPAPGTGEAKVRMVDVKTAAQPMTQMEAFLQAYLYFRAIQEDPALPDTDDIAFYLARHDKYQQGRIDNARHRRLASRILNGRARQIIMGQFEPSYGHWCKRCDFNDLCSTEISMWRGDGMVLELM